MSRTDVLQDVQRNFSHMWHAPSRPHPVLKLPLVLNVDADRGGDLIKPLWETVQNGGEAPRMGVPPPVDASSSDGPDAADTSITAATTTDTIDATTATASSAEAKANSPPPFVEAAFCSGEVRRLAQETGQRLKRGLPCCDLNDYLHHDDGHRYVMPMLLHTTSYGADVLHVARNSLHERRLARRWEPVAKKRGPCALR